MTANDGYARRSVGADHAARRQRRIGWTATIILSAVYLLYLFLIIVAPQAMSANIGGNVTPGLALGAGVIFVALGLSFYYVAQANRNETEQGGRP
jgi:uncharacterized membrane protein (DUF485 family)